MTGTRPTVRAHVYTSDPLTTHVERLRPDDAYQDYFDLPDDLVSWYESSQDSLIQARQAIEKYIADNQLTEQPAPFDGL
jgi:hypothetical protein